eukprot:60797_1
MAQFTVDVYAWCVLEYNWTVNEFMERSKFLSSIPKTSKVWCLMRRHLHEYTKTIMDCTPFESHYHYTDRIPHYISIIHNKLRRCKITQQLDVIFVPHHLPRIEDTFERYNIQYETISTDVDYISRNYDKPMGRYCLMVVPNADNETDTIYVFKPLHCDSIPPQICDFTELSWIYNTTTHILPGFNLEDHNAFCISFHRHRDAERVYFTSSPTNTMRVHKRNMLSLFGDEKWDEYEEKWTEFKDDAFDRFVMTYFPDLGLMRSQNNGYHKEKWPQRVYDYHTSDEDETEIQCTTPTTPSTDDDDVELITFNVDKMMCTELQFVQPDTAPCTVQPYELIQSKTDPAMDTRCLHYLQHIATDSTPEPMDNDGSDAPFELTLSSHDSSEPEPESPTPITWDYNVEDVLREWVDIPRHNAYSSQDMGHLMNVYSGGASSNTNAQISSHQANDANDNGSDEKKDAGDGSDDAFRGGGGNNDGDEKKNNDKHTKHAQTDTDQPDEEEEEDEVFKLLMQIPDMKDDDVLSNLLSSFSPHAVHHVADKVFAGINDLNAALVRMTRIVKAIQPTPNNQPAKPIIQVTKPRAVPNYTRMRYTPVKRLYYISRECTKKIIPQTVAEHLVIDSNSVYEFMVKALSINTPVGNHWVQIYDLGLHHHISGESVYFIARRMDPCKRYIIDRIATKEEVNQVMKQHNISTLPVAVQMAPSMEDMKEIEESIASIAKDIVKDIKWGKIPVYNRKNSTRRMTLSLTNEKFEKCYETFVDRNTVQDMTLIPIVMFSEKDVYRLEHIWMVSVEDDVDIGVSFEYNKAEHTVQVVGIHLDKELILKQHQVICPSDCNLLRDARFHITDLHIGNPDDHQNRNNAHQKRIKTLKKELMKAREENANLKEANANCLACPAQSVSPTVSSTCLDGDGLAMDICTTPLVEDTSSLSEISERKPSLPTNAYPASPSVSISLISPASSASCQSSSNLKMANLESSVSYPEEISNQE